MISSVLTLGKISVKIAATSRRGLHPSLRREGRDQWNDWAQRIYFLDEISEVQRNGHMASSMIPNCFNFSDDNSFKLTPKRSLLKKVFLWSKNIVSYISHSLQSLTFLNYNFYFEIIADSLVIDFDIPCPPVRMRTFLLILFWCRGWEILEEQGNEGGTRRHLG